MEVLFFFGLSALGYAIGIVIWFAFLGTLLNKICIIFGWEDNPFAYAGHDKFFWEK